MTSGSRGSTSTLAKGPTSDRTPNVPAITGAVASCAASVTANGSTSTRGPGTRRAIGTARKRIPAVPRNESWKPTSVATAGSIASSSAEQSASSANECGRRPSRAEQQARPHHQAAAHRGGAGAAEHDVHRQHDQSHHVLGGAATSLAGGLNPPINPATITTFSPLTATMWIKPGVLQGLADRGRQRAVDAEGDAEQQRRLRLGQSAGHRSGHETARLLR